jgi:hypothetical protein
MQLLLSCHPSTITASNSIAYDMHCIHSCTESKIFRNSCAVLVELMGDNYSQSLQKHSFLSRVKKTYLTVRIITWPLYFPLVIANLVTSWRFICRLYNLFDNDNFLLMLAVILHLQIHRPGTNSLINGHLKSHKTITLCMQAQWREPITWSLVSCVHWREPIPCLWCTLMWTNHLPLVASRADYEWVYFGCNCNWSAVMSRVRQQIEHNYEWRIAWLEKFWGETMFYKR